MARAQNILYYLGGTIAALSLILLAALSGWDGFPLRALISASTIAVFAATLWHWQRRMRSLFDPFALFFVFAMLFNGGYAFLTLLQPFSDYQSTRLASYPASTAEINLAMFMVFLALFAFGAGGRIALRNIRRDVVMPRRVNNPEYAHLLTLQRQTGWLMVFIALIPAMIYMRQLLGVVEYQSYVGIYKEYNLNLWQRICGLMVGVLVAGCIFIVADGQRRPAQAWLATGLAASVGLAYLFIGKRGIGLLIVVGVAFVWHHLVRRLPWWLLTAVPAMIMCFVVPVLAHVRGLESARRMSLAVYVETFRNLDDTLLQTLDEMAGSFRTVLGTYQLVPDLRGFDYGLSYLYAFFAPVIERIPLFPSNQEMSLSHWLAHALIPERALRSEGYGFSYIAEMYLNFGWPGVVIISFFLGWLVAHITARALISRHPVRISVLAIAIVYLTLFTRGESLGVFRPILYYILLPVALMRCLQYLTASQPITRSRENMPAADN